ncbi:LexA family transcriptional regulator [Collinsella sp. AM43-1]|uniref:helix-turn-helix domain-containing protein n=1 Tax=Collinsella sp. AM43-1 TaxID=2292322 RepID=UPI000E4EE1D8|nr:LexA family transcriptional regulator [Collinsella sp. AM43-1]RHA69473.1 LexA family transcriptional regulator [Collinsella sp. AM43-1]
MEFGEKLRSLRIKAGLTQLDIAEKLDVSAAAIGAWENGRAKPRLTKLGQLAELLGTSAADLMGETPEPVRPNGAQYVTLPVLVAGHAGEFTDEFGPDEVADVPISVLERVNDPDAYLMRVRGSCMNRRFADGENALLSPRCEPRNGDAVAAEYNGEMILRSYYRGASTLVLSPDSYEDGYTDIVFDDPENASVSFRGVVKWHQASEVKRY